MYFQANGFRSSEVTLAFGGFFKDPSFKQVIWPYPYYTQIQMPDYISFWGLSGPGVWGPTRLILQM